MALPALRFVRRCDGAAARAAMELYGEFLTLRAADTVAIDQGAAVLARAGLVSRGRRATWFHGRAPGRQTISFSCQVRRREELCGSLARGFSITARRPLSVSLGRAGSS